MEYQRPESRVIIGNAMIPDNLVAEGYTGTLCFSICQDPLDFDEEKRKFFDVSLTLRQLYELKQALTDYLYGQLTNPLLEDRFINESSDNL